MPTRKQRRREAKLRRHEWEEVYVDAEGRELDPDEVEGTSTTPTNGRRPERKNASGASAPPRSGLRGIQPPSWRRVLRRGAIFAPLMFLTVHFLSPDDVTTVQKATQTAFLLLVFMPFSYVMDAVTYRMFERRKRTDAARGRKPS